MTRADEALRELRARLAASPSAALDAELLLAGVLDCSRAALAARGERELSEGQVAALRSLAARRAAGEPLAYLTGRREFWSLDFEVTPDVLVPRPETELLVELALAAIADVRSPAVLDLGTGSGAVAIAIAHERPDAAVLAVDASAAALAVAERNAARLAPGRVRFARGSWYGPAGDARFHAIVANPPYLAADDPALAGLAHEPRIALVAGPAGTEALALVCAGAPARLLPGARLAVEHGASQDAAVRGMMAAAGLAGIATHRDLAGHARATCGTASH